MIKTLAELKAYFETGDKPTQTEFENLIDSTYRGYKVYTAIVTISDNTNVVTVLQNTIGDINWTFGPGVISITSNELFTTGKTFIQIDLAYIMLASGLKIEVSTQSSSQIAISSPDGDVSELGSYQPIEIRVYN
jgi:hypothetical protein